MSPAMVVEGLSKVYKRLTRKEEVVEIDIETLPIERPKSPRSVVQEEGGLAHATTAIDADQRGGEVNLAKDATLYRIAQVAQQVIVCSIECLHYFILMLGLDTYILVWQRYANFFN